MKKENVIIWVLLCFTGFSVLVGLVTVMFRPPWRVPAVEPKILSESVIYPKKDYIGLVRIYDVIRDDLYVGPWYSSYVERIVKQLEMYAMDKRVKGIIIRVNSPGGTVASAQEIFRAIRRVRQEWGIPVVACLGDVATSGGYYIAAAADHIVANPGTITGSIGVIMETFDLSSLLDGLGVKPRIIKEGKYKDIGSIFREMTPEEETLLKESLQEVYRKMLEDISSARSTLSLEQLQDLADGRIFTGVRAKEVGLVDSLGGVEEAITVIMEEANLKERPYVLDHPKMTWETFFEMFSYYFNEHLLPKALFKKNISEYLNTFSLR